MSPFLMHQTHMKTLAVLSTITYLRHLGALGSSKFDKLVKFEGADAVPGQLGVPYKPCIGCSPMPTLELENAGLVLSP